METGKLQMNKELIQEVIKEFGNLEIGKELVQN